MAQNYLGQALMGIGGQLPGLVQARRTQKREEELDPLRKRLLESQVGAAEISAGEARTSAEQKEEARRAIEEAMAILTRTDEPEQVIPSYEKPEFKSDAGLPEKVSPLGLKSDDLMKKYSIPADIKTVGAQKKPSVSEALFRTGAAKYMDQPVVKNFAEQFDLSKVLASTTGSGGLKGKWSQQSAAGTPEDTAAANARIDELVSDGKITPGQEAVFRRYAGVNPINTLEILNRKDFGVEADVRKYEEITPLAVERSGGTSAATTYGKEGAEQDILRRTKVEGYKPEENSRITEKNIQDITDARPQLEVLEKEINDLVSEYEKNGWKPIGPEAAAYDSKARIVQLLSKEAKGGLFNLGVLNGPDLGILNELITSPGAFGSGVKMARYGKQHIGIRLNNVRDLVEYKKDRFFRANHFVPDIPEEKQPSASKRFTIESVE